MSETERFVGKIQLIQRLCNETDKDYFERVTNCKWKKYDWEPNSIQDAIYDNDISYYEAKNGNEGYICVQNYIYKFLELKNKDIEDSYCDMQFIGSDTYEFDTMFYNGGASLNEVLADEIISRTEMYKHMVKYIDDVSVSGCMFYSQTRELNCKAKNICCETHPNCQYKYHYRKIKQLESENEAYKQSEGEAKEIIAELKAENEKLKKSIETYEYQLEKRIEICDSWFESSNKYKQYLDEIEKCIECSNCKYNKCDDYNNCSPVKCDEIYKLIKQAKEGVE